VDLGDWEDEEMPPVVQEEPQIAHPLNDPPINELGLAPDQAGVPAVAAPELAELLDRRNALRHAINQAENAAPPAADANPPPPAERNNFNLAVSTNRLAESILGALAFPAVSAVMGEMLHFVLPKALTSYVPGRYGKPTGLLQARWGRSLVGGCMFVVLKDAVMLYVRWRMARDHRMRKVLDYKGKKSNRGGSGKVGSPSS